MDTINHVWYAFHVLLLVLISCFTNIIDIKQLPIAILIVIIMQFSLYYLLHGHIYA